MSDIMVLVWSLLLPTLCSIWQSTPLFLLGESPWTDEPGGLQSMGSQRIGHNWAIMQSPMDGGAWWAAVHGVEKSRTWLSDFTFTFHFYALEKEMATHSLQCSCLENPRDGGAWWTAVYGVAQSRTRLKWLSSSRVIMHKHINIYNSHRCQHKRKQFYYRYTHICFTCNIDGKDVYPS